MGHARKTFSLKVYRVGPRGSCSVARRPTNTWIGPAALAGGGGRGGTGDWSPANEGSRWGPAHQKTEPYGGRYVVTFVLGQLQTNDAVEPLNIQQ